MTDNKVGAMTNSPHYDWHLPGIYGNYANLTPRGAAPQHRRRFARALRSGKRDARIAGRFHAAFAVREGGRLR